MAESRQLSLPVGLNDEATFDNFYVSAANRVLVSALLASSSAETPEQCVYLYGSESSGRSHLLQAICHQASTNKQQPMYLSLAELAGYPPEAVLENLEQYDWVCLDDIQEVLGKPDWEEQLFHLFNRLREHGTPLLMAADVAPRQLPIELADLQSRLSWAVVYQLQSLSDQDKQNLLQLRAARRGLELSDEVAQYIILRSSRSTGDLIDLLDNLDHEALSARRKLTIPFVKEICGW